MKPRAGLAAINITPLVDVLLILVATLLLLAPQLVKQLPVDLPKTSIEGAPHLQRSLLITLNAQGVLQVDGQVLGLKDVLSRIQQGETTVEIAASKGVSYDAVVGLVESLRTAEPHEILLLTR